ncbi:C39 family peptidase [Candidatus Uhrbacteria bacterium]|nr:C39 family peptidase [Candidatus Uhrbacteria bacterium]
MSWFLAMAMAATAATSMIELPVPYVPQAIDGRWVAPWDEACEEASLLMVEGYYEKNIVVDEQIAKKRMQSMIDWEMVVFNKFDDTDADETRRLIDEHAAFEAHIIRNPSLDSIKDELSAGRPVIAMVDMFDLYAERDLGDSYHVLVISGFDVAKKEFIVRDPARDTRRFSYTRLMAALHDYDPITREASGVPTVLFTSPPEPDLTVMDFLKKISNFFWDLFN